MAFLTPESVVLVTASSAGLGAATARAFAARGVNVVVNYLNSRDKV
jgi:NAD(P)-dependent dehydrogenase (short-subunit alcohol dehydrogenase family)